MKKTILVCFQLLSGLFLFAQDKGNKSIYHPQDYYLPFFIPPGGTPFRSAKGTPGPIYWQLPVEIWQRGNTWTFKYPSTSKISKLILDPENVVPELDRKNNEWNGK